MPTWTVDTVSAGGSKPPFLINPFSPFNFHPPKLIQLRWLFIFDGLISIPIALWGFYALPDQPADSKARWLSLEVHHRRDFHISLS